MSDDGAGFFRNLTGYATEYVRSKRKALQSEPETQVDSTGGTTGSYFNGQDIDFEELREIKEMRESGGQVAQLMSYKALLNFGEGAEIHVEDDEETEQVVDGTPMTLSEWLETEAFPHLDTLVLDMGEDALWYPAAVGEILETQTGDFGEFLPAEPWTILPVTDERGQVVAWKQRTVGEGGYTEQTLEADAVANIILNKRSARDKTGISEVLRNADEITAFKENEQAINQAIELHGFPQRHVKVGKEDGAPVRDDDLRRVRTIFDPRTSDANTAYFTGQDVDVETLEAENFDYGAVHEMDMRNLTTALGLPLEAGNVGADGLGSGKPAELRFSLLKLAIKANQRRFSEQFVQKVIRPVVRDYSPFNHTATISVEIDDPLEDIGEVADLIQKVGDYMTNAEARRRLDLPEPEDDEVAESYRSPGEIEKAEEGDGQGGDPLAGLFSDDRTLQDVEDVAMDDYPEAAQENARMALEAREDTGNPNDCLTSTGWAVANNLDSGDPISPDQLESMSAFERFEDDKEQGEEGRADCGWMAWKAWGGDEGIAWADDKQDELDEARQASDGGSGNAHSGVAERDLEAAPEWDRPLLEMYQGVTTSDDTGRTLVDFAASGTPAFVLDRIRDAIHDGAIFADIEAIDGDEIMEFRQVMADAVGTDDFTLDSITEDVMDFAGVDRDKAETIARTESSAALNRAREIGYEERGEGDELFYWTGAEPGDDRQTEACEWLIKKTNPFHGGEPRPMDELRDMLTDAAEQDPDIPKSMVREDSWTIHINERSTFSKAPPGWRDL